ncbi:hypothetical protein IPA_05025 [Ignicoccus pacificus DSM 13166]|uniref:Uncharacterized protein n=1 Tax=Ignicoccus pacificus DSM 13166 TaxID=940294 RepID=A0A977KBB9_9CREN|nr:hypothetical protein IPA_05025 [Ignicoccus pacificus DSM 13166]
MKTFQTLFWGKARVPERPRHAYGTDPIRLRISAIFAYEDMLKGSMISKAFPIEVLLYYYGTHQISEALERSRRELNKVTEAYFADIEIPPSPLWIGVLEPRACLFKLAPRDWFSRVMELRYYKRKRWKI